MALRLLRWIPLGVCALLAEVAAAGMATLQPLRDNTLIQRAEPAEQLSNGQGDLFVGRTNQDGSGPATVSIRRALVMFDVAGAIPSGATITGVTLTLRDVMSQNGDQSIELHRTLQDWGEGGSSGGSQGAPAQQHDATWLYRFFDEGHPTASPAWNTPGGDFSSAPSGVAVVDDDGGPGRLFTWDGALYPQMLADLQSWLDEPGANFGWTITGNEMTGQTAKRLNSGESAAPPLLVVTYSTVPGDGNGDGCVTGADYTIWADHFGAGPGATQEQGDYNADGFVTGGDYTVWADHFGQMCSPAASVPEPASGLLLAALLIVGAAAGAIRNR